MSITNVHAIPIEPIEERSAALEPRLVITNDWNCRSNNNPVVVLHGLLSNRNLGLNLFEAWLRPQGYCTFALTYGNYPAFPLIGGLKPVPESAQQIVDFIKEVLRRTGAKKVDLVGHSEGGFQALYVAKVMKMSQSIDKIVGIAPPTHGTSFNSVVDLAELLNIRGEAEAVLKALGCPACTDLIKGGAPIKALSNGPIVQAGNKVTIIATKYDSIVTPAGTASFIQQPGVFNNYTQDKCLLDFAGHANIAINTNAYHLTLNALRGQNSQWFLCTPFSGLPFKN